MLSLAPNLESDDIKSTGMGQSGVDVQLSPAAQKLFPVAIECKNLAKFAGYTHYDQAVNNRTDKLEPIVVVKANRRDPIVLVDLEYFMTLLRQNNRSSNV